MVLFDRQINKLGTWLKRWNDGFHASLISIDECHKVSCCFEPHLLQQANSLNPFEGLAVLRIVGLAFSPALWSLFRCDVHRRPLCRAFMAALRWIELLFA